MTEMQYVALLRGINVGGSNIIKMLDLKASFEDMGFLNVATYIQSGNVLFNSRQRKGATLAAAIESGLSKRFNYESRVVVRSHKQFKATVDDAPTGYGQDPTRYRYDVLFVKEPVKPAEIMDSITLKEGVDRAWAGQGVVYFSRLAERASQSRLPKLVILPIYKSVTARNWNTTLKLLAVLDARG
jgi:uncharacterized protein (DUF1697 family)